MDRQQYLRRVDECIERVEDWLEAFDPDEVDYSTSDGVVTLEFPDKTRFVLNRQTAADQMWFAASASAWHYNWSDGEGTWVSDKDGHRLLDRIGETVSQKLGRSVRLR